MCGAELKTGLRNAAAQDGMPAHRMKHTDVQFKATKNAVKLIAGQKTLFSVEEVEPCRSHLPDLNSSSSCWGWESLRQPGERADAAMAEECAE